MKYWQTQISETDGVISVLMYICVIGTMAHGQSCELLHPAYKPPPAFCTKAKVAKGGVYLRDTTVYNK